MDNVTDRLLDAIGAILIMLIFSSVIFSWKENDMIMSAAAQITDGLTKRMATCGYLDADMYREYLQDLAKTGVAYSVELEHVQRVYNSDCPEGYEYHTYSMEILRSVDERGAYLMQVGDTITVTVTERGRSTASAYAIMLLGHDSSPTYSVSRGITGMSRTGYMRYFGSN